MLPLVRLIPALAPCFRTIFRPTSPEGTRCQPAGTRQRRFSSNLAAASFRRRPLRLPAQQHSSHGPGPADAPGLAPEHAGELGTPPSRRRNCRNCRHRPPTPVCQPPLNRPQAIFFAALALTCSAMPVVTFVFSLQFASAELGPFAYAYWAIVGATSALAVLAHAAGSRRAAGGNAMRSSATHCTTAHRHARLASLTRPPACLPAPLQSC